MMELLEKYIYSRHDIQSSSAGVLYLYFDYLEREIIKISPLSQAHKEGKNSEIFNEDNVVFKTPLNNTKILKNLANMWTKSNLNQICSDICLRYEFQGVLD